MNPILAGVAVLGGLGLAFGLFLGIASRFFAVETDPRLERICDLMPHVNCGACGYAGCEAFAEALVKDPSLIGTCTSCTPEARKKIGDVLGIEVKAGEAPKVQLACRGGVNCIDKCRYDGIKSCSAAALIMEGSKACGYACLGFGDCAKACPFGAIIIREEGYPEIIHDKCRGCSICVDVCPRNLIRPFPRDGVFVACSSKDKGAVTRKICSNGCIGCGRCVRACPSDAISLFDNLAIIDYDKCTRCYECVEVCPTGAIRAIESA